MALLSTPVTTDATGSFTITGPDICPSASSQLYLVATGGNPGLDTPTNNASLVLMAAVGACTLQNGQYTLDPSLFINIDEVTTVASVYALAGFMDPISSRIGASATNSGGIANAFLAVSNLVNIKTGQALTTTSAGNGAVPQAEINSLADILADCVNSTGTGSSCTALFSAATPSGGSAPTNTIQAIFNIATHPAQQVDTLYALSSATPPFQPTLGAAPKDWTLALHYTGGELTNPLNTSIDSLGNVWIANNPGSVIKLSSNGVNLSGPTGFTGGGISGPRSVAIDQSDNAWVANFFGKSVTKLSSSGATLSGANGFTNGINGANGPTNVAIDGYGAAWITNSAVNNGSGPTFTITKLAGDGTLIADSISPCLSATNCELSSGVRIAGDASGNIWIANSNPGPGAVIKLNNAGTVLSGQSGFTSGIISPVFIAFDHAGDAWVVNTSSDGTNNYVTKLDSNGTLLNSVNAPGIFEPVGIAIDGSGNAWINSFGQSIVELSNNLTVLSGTNGYIDAAPLLTYPGCTIPPSVSCTIPRDTEAIAIDGSGNVWVSNTDSSVSEFVGAATPVVTPLSLAVKNNTLGTRP